MIFNTKDIWMTIWIMIGLFGTMFLFGCYTRQELIYEKEKSYQDGYQKGIEDSGKIKEASEEKNEG